jgi:[ribosomal protein S5]-alanine N-acetyltransferase
MALEPARAPEHLTTPRMRAESVRAGHLDGLARIMGPPAFGRTMGGVKPREQVAADIERLGAHWETLGFGLWSFFIGEELVARGGLMPADVDGEPAVEVAWGVHPDHWGKGLATEIGAASLEVAWRDLRLSEVVAFTLPHNVPSRRVMEKLGMTYTGDTIHAGMPHVLYRLPATVNGA